MMSPVQRYANLRVGIDGRVLSFLRLPLPPPVAAPQVPSVAVGKSTYLGRIRGAIEYRSMPPLETMELETWYVDITGDSIVCAWGQLSGDRIYLILLGLKSEQDGWEYQNPPTELKRILFAWASAEEPVPHGVESIPDIVADHSLAALPYMATPSWAWPVLGGVGIAALVGLIWVVTKK